MIAILRRAFTLLRFRFLLLQFSLALGVFLLFVGWLRIPDANFAELAASVLVAVLILILVLEGETVLLRRMRLLPTKRRELLRGAAAMLAAVILWYLWSTFLDAQSAKNFERAGYWNSRFSHGLRNTFSYSHLLLWLSWIWASLLWCGTGLLVSGTIAVAQSERWVRAMLAVWRSATYWIVFLLSAFLGVKLTSLLIHWAPGHGLAMETVSVALRLGAVILLDLLLACFGIAVVSALTMKADGYSESMPAGTPEPSQPRTEEIP